MAHLDSRGERGVSSEMLRPSRLFDPRTDTERALLSSQAAQFVFQASAGSVVALGGIDGVSLRDLVDQAANISDERRALFVRLRSSGSVEQYVEQVISVLADTAQRLWPLWFSDVSFAMCRDNALGYQSAGMVARETASRVWPKSAAGTAT
jgi:hypothetical protein